MESVEDHFVSMIIDRLQALEQTVDELRASNELLRSELSTQTEKVHLTMTDNREGGSGDPVPLDEKHWNAVVFPGKVAIQILEETDTADSYFSNHKVSIGRVCHPVTVRELVEGVQRALRVRWDHGDEPGIYNGMLPSRKGYHDMKLCVTF